MIRFVLALALALATGVHAYDEFGLLRKLNNRNAHDKEGDMRGLLELERILLVKFSFSMSMSVDYSLPTLSLSPNTPLWTVAPLATPTSVPSTLIPTITMSPSDYVSQPPTPVTNVVPTLDTVEPLYPSDAVSLAPTRFEEQPLIANVGGNTGSNGSRRWILGTCLGIVGGVILALMAVVTKKRRDHTGNAKKKKLQDGESSEETSIDHGDNILTGMTSPEIPAVENA